ncbi:TolC family protein [Paenimyroides tangerinum]|uniref:TolC family protein n=1 Tax=Paenimyroides tangerinum TaxID=2488728 RepID=A0A3P3W7R8_9FLAO|nr:TolC family protein [Paenimyroides tangerinum]RRJ91212.1 TolC family protein [Paenimyroides tangerinum]
MRKSIFYISLLVCTQLNAQGLSLEKALELANNPEYKQAELEVLKQEINLKIQKNKRLPLIYGDANVQRNLIVPVTPVPAIAFNPNAEPGEITPLKFATDWSAKAGLQLSLDLFNSQNQLNIKQAENQNRKAEIDKQQSAEDFKKLIIDLYAQAYLAQQQFEVSVLNENNFRETLQIIIKRNEAGRVSDLEKNAALQKAYELQLTVDESELILQNKYLQLANYFDITVFDSISTSIDDIIQQNLTIADYEIEQLKLEIDAKEIEIQNNKLTSIPKLTFNAFYGGQFYDNQLKITNSDNWFGNSYVNLALRIPITENFEKRLKTKQFDFDKEIIQSKLETLEREKLNSDKQQQNDLLILSQKIQAYKQIVSLSESNVKIVKAQVDAGTVLISEYNKELENLFSQNQKLWQTSYDLLKKRLE